MAAAEFEEQSISNGAIAEGIYSLANTSKRYNSLSLIMREHKTIATEVKHERNKAFTLLLLVKT